jgi:ATP-dependent protease HslVU (ClpYQ) peptidase subunit
MTTIVAVQYEDKVKFGADSLITATRKYSHPRMAKITQRGQYLIAGAGESAACDIAQHIWVPPKPLVDDKKDLYHFMISRVVPSLKQCFKNNEYKWDSGEDEEARFAFLIAIGGEVFDIADDFAVCMDSDGIYGIGSGSSLAIGALKSGATIAKSLSIAASKDPYTAPPFTYFTQNKWIN